VVGCTFASQPGRRREIVVVMQKEGRSLGLGTRMCVHVGFFLFPFTAVLRAGIDLVVFGVSMREATSFFWGVPDNATATTYVVRI